MLASQSAACKFAFCMQGTNVMVCPLNKTQRGANAVMELLGTWRSIEPMQVVELLKRTVSAVHDLTDAAASKLTFMGRYSVLQQQLLPQQQPQPSKPQEVC